MKNVSLQKRVVIYPKSEKQKRDWEREADKRVTSLSKYLLGIIEEAHGGPSLTETEAMTELKLQAIEVETDNRVLKQEILRLNKLLSLQEDEIKELKSKAFLEQSFSGVRSFDRALVSLLQSKDKAFNQDALMAGLNIHYTDSEAIKSLAAQLDALTEYKLVTITGRGWKWLR